MKNKMSKKTDVGSPQVVGQVWRNTRGVTTNKKAIAAAIDISGKEDVANKQNDLTVDGTGTKYATIDVVNESLGDIESILLSI
jgi:hypothetical protein